MALTFYLMAGEQVFIIIQPTDMLRKVGGNSQSTGPCTGRAGAEESRADPCRSQGWFPVKTAI